MRLSDVKGERTLDVIADLVEPVANIASDKELAKLFTQGGKRKGETDGQLLARRAKSAVPALLKKHREDVLAILSTLHGVTPEEYAADMSLASVLGDCYELLTDSEFLSFLSLPEQTAE